jgi:predicted RNA binding protein YcfA (HicA-like mRNA interferase family)
MLVRLGFELVRQSGSHRIYRNTEGTRITVPFHRGRTLHPKLIAQIRSDLGISSSEFAAALR